jgi:hypothetical protein
MHYLERILNALDGVRPISPGRWRARCPGHKDCEPSLQVTVGRDGDRILLRCWSGCSLGEILQALSLQHRDLFENPSILSRHFRISKTDYESAKFLLQFHRADRKCGYQKGRPTAADLIKLREAAGVVREYRRERAR